MTPRDFFGNFFTLDPRQVDWKRTAILVLLVLLVASLLWHRYMPEIRELTTTEFRKVPDIREVHDVQRVYIPCPQQGIKVLDKQELAEKLGEGWQQAIAQRTVNAGPVIVPIGPGSPIGTTSDATDTAPAANLEVTATADIPETENGAEALSVIDTTTGESTIVIKEKVAPWFEFENGLVAGIRYGINTSAEQTGTLYAGWEFLRIKDLHFIGYGEASADFERSLQRNVQGKVQLDIQYRRK